MARTNTFERDIKVATAELEPAAISALLAKTAHEEVTKAQRAGEFPREYTSSVNGRIGALFESVVPPGPIVAVARWWPEVLEYGVAFAKARSPQGVAAVPTNVKRARRANRRAQLHYVDAWFVLANGEVVTEYDGIPLTAECIITNDRPYARKIEVGHQKVTVPPGIVEDLVSALRRKFGDLLTVRSKFIPLSGGWVTEDGRAISYPSAVISMRF